MHVSQSNKRGEIYNKNKGDFTETLQSLHEKSRTLSTFLYTHTTTTTTTQEIAGPWPVAERDCESEVWRKELVFVA